MISCIMVLTVLFREVDESLHKRVKSESAIIEVPIYKIYNNAMDGYSVKMKYNRFPVRIRDEPKHSHRDKRVEKVDSEIYKSFKITCIQKDISISQGINLALASWLESQEDDNGGLEHRT